VEEQERHNREHYRMFATEPFAVEYLDKLGSEKCARALGALADRQIILSVADFARLAGQPELAKQAADCLPGIYGRLTATPDFERLVERNPYPLSDAPASGAHKNLASNLAGRFSLEKEAACDRSLRSALRLETPPAPKTTFEKAAADNRPAAELATQYAIYKLDALERIARTDLNFPLTARFSVRQNYVFNA
jgi:hypothetical protein